MNYDAMILREQVVSKALSVIALAAPVGLVFAGVSSKYDFQLGYHLGMWMTLPLQVLLLAVCVIVAVLRPLGFLWDVVKGRTRGPWFAWLLAPVGLLWTALVAWAVWFCATAAVGL
jgi:hypothetical protein